MNTNVVKWLLFVMLCLIWGSSFELMKLGMYENHDFSKPILSPYQVAAIRMLSAGLVMLPFALKALKQLTKDVLWYTVLSGLLGSFFPAFLFCLAETKIGGGVAGSLNALTPIFVIVTGTLFFNITTNTQKIMGVLVAVVGSALLLYANTKGQTIDNFYYSIYVIIATVMYGINVNMVSKRLQGVSSTNIAAIAFASLILPAAVILYFTQYFSLPLGETKYIIANSAAATLGILGTALASILFYILVKKAGGLFASTVTYGIPFVAIGWGLIHAENIGILHFVGLCIILGGVYLANR
jgi:drug/metabolite transporter (DMT)-like permease